MKHSSYLKAKWFERLIAELEQSVGQMEDNDLERIIFMCWVEQQNRMKEEKEKECSDLKDKYEKS